MTLRYQLLKHNLKKLANNRRELLPGWSPTYFQRLGPIDLIIDVGVCYGTPELYKAYPNSYLVLCEALPNFEITMQEILDVHGGGGEYHMCAVTDFDGALDFNVVVDDVRLSGHHQSLMDSKERKVVSVKASTLDSLIGSTILKLDEKVVLLKIDTEGGELNVVRGAKETLKNCDFVVTETSIMKRHENSYQFAELISLMSDNGFELFDIITVTRKKSLFPGARIADCVFKRVDNN